jgi:hypothetical protein
VFGRVIRRATKDFLTRFRPKPTGDFILVGAITVLSVVALRFFWGRQSSDQKMNELIAYSLTAIVVGFFIWAFYLLRTPFLLFREGIYERLDSISLALKDLSGDHEKLSKEFVGVKVLSGRSDKRLDGLVKWLFGSEEERGRIAGNLRDFYEEGRQLEHRCTRGIELDTLNAEISVWIGKVEAYLKENLPTAVQYFLAPVPGDWSSTDRTRLLRDIKHPLRQNTEHRCYEIEFRTHQLWWISEEFPG